MSSQIKCEVGPDSEHTPELPLDFSTHKNKKSRITSFNIGKAGLDLEPMKSPSEILNLTKEDRSSSPCSQRSWSSSCSLSPSMEGGTTQSQLTPSLGLGLSNLGLTSNGVPHPPGQGGLDLLQSPFQLGQLQYPLNISPWGMVPPPSSLSPGSMGADLYPPNGGNGGGIVGGNGTSGGKVRTTRPFKAYPKDPMSFSMYGLPGAAGSEIFAQQSQQAYAEFRKQMLSSSQLQRGRRASSVGGSSGSKRSSSPEPLPQFQDQLSSSGSGKSGSQNGGRKTDQQMKDEAYWERRRKNNEAAKRSRDARRAKEDEIAIRAAFLEQENLKLRFELCALKSEANKLRCMLYTS